MAEQVEKKLNSLNEAEQALVNDIMNVKTSVAESRRQTLFNKIKNECVDKINKMIEENSGDEKERLLNLKETILLKEYDKNSIVEDIAKLLEIGAILSDNEHDKYM
jgi:gas vesicle protein